MIFRAAQNCFNIPCIPVCCAPQTTAMRTVSLLFIPQSEAQIAHTAFWPGCTLVQSVHMYVAKILLKLLVWLFSNIQKYILSKWYLYFFMLLSGCITTQILCTVSVHVWRRVSFYPSVSRHPVSYPWTADTAGPKLTGCRLYSGCKHLKYQI